MPAPSSDPVIERADPESCTLACTATATATLTGCAAQHTLIGAGSELLGLIDFETNLALR